MSFKALCKALAFFALLDPCLSSAIPSSPIFSSDLSIEKRQSSPLLNLGYATYSASIYNSDADIYTFRNIRYAAPLTGLLRWRKPQPPLNMSGIQDGSVGFSCLQPGATPTPQSEDCLFLDVYVPGKAVRNPSAFKLPVSVWVHGGNNLNGAKDQKPSIFFNGTGPVITSNNSLIFVATNYRLGPWGWLAGNTMEQQGLPNAGLHDQRAAFQWVQTYISLLGGDKTQVTAWGESAGASNLLHQLVAEGGKLDPLFSKAMLLSPASITVVDRLGMLENCFQNYTSLANCTGQGLACLRAATNTTLQAAANALFASHKVCGGVATDGTYIRQAATLEFASNNYWKTLQSVIVTHVSNESVVFVPANSSTDAAFQAFVSSQLPTYAVSGGVVQSILNFYPSPSPTGTYPTEFARFLGYIRDSSITIRVAAIALAYWNNVWAGEYSVPPGLHATDLIPLFWNIYLNDTTEPGVGANVYPVPSNILALSATYQSYMVSHAMTGNPNTNANIHAASYPAIFWPKPGNFNNQELTNVLNFTSQGVSLVTDNEVLATPLDFQLQVAAAITNQGGYAVPGTVQSSGSVGNVTTTQASSSSNYVDQCTECRE